MRRILFTETDFNTLPNPPAGFKYIGFDATTGHFTQKDDTGSSTATNVTAVNEVSYSELTLLIGSQSLTPGSYYLIDDFRTCYDQPDYDYYMNPATGSNYRTAEVEPLLVFAISTASISTDAYQYKYPNDSVKYDWTWNQTEVSGGTAYGRITERIDEFNNRTDYDHRTILFKRYKTRFLNGTGYGRILAMNNGLVIGTGSNFTNYATGSVVFIESDNYPAFYKVMAVTSDTEMTVSGTSYYNFESSYGFQYQSTYTNYGTLIGSLYYFNDEGNNYINDGGDDMYDNGNYINTNLYSDIPYTHTQMSQDNGAATFSDFTFDGTVQSSDSIFGTGSSYFTNTYPGLFVMAAYDVDIETFSITGGLGSDGDGQADMDKFTFEGFTIYTKRVWDAGDPSINHIIIVNTIDEGIVHTADLSTEDDDDMLSNLEGVTQIHYLLFGLAGGVKATDKQMQDVYKSYLNTINNTDINATLSILYTDYTNITDNLPTNESFYSCLEVTPTNIVGDEVDFREILTFDIQISARNTYIGNSCDSWSWDNRPFMLPNNVFTNAYGNTVDVYDNIFGNMFINNTFGDDVYQNRVGDSANKNICIDRFDRNIIGTDFSGNVFYSLEFENNHIGNYFFQNIMIDGNDCYDNNIGNNFTDNKFFSGSSLRINRIENYFSNNEIFKNFEKNEISNGFNNNIIFKTFNKNVVDNDLNNNHIYNNFNDNKIGNTFTENTIGDALSNFDFTNNIIANDAKGNYILGNFWNNTIDYGFYSNTIDDYFSNNKIGPYFFYNDIGTNYYSNSIMDNFYSNEIGNEFFNNHIGNSFDNNTIANNFAHNTIANNFSSNNIENDFGFGSASPRGNKIGNRFQDNHVGEYFYDNNISDNFIGNTMSLNFQYNDVKAYVQYTDFSTYNGNILTFTYSFGGELPSDHEGVQIIGNTFSNVSGTYSYGGSTASVVIDATFDIYVVDAGTLAVTLNNPGNLYLASIGATTSIITIPESLFANGYQYLNDSLVITITGVSDLPSVYGEYNTEIFTKVGGVNRLSYYDASDVLTITDIDK